MVYYIKLKAVLCWNQDPKVKVKNEADRVLVCQRKAHTHVLPDIWRRERRGGWGRRVHVWTLSCLRGRMTESASPHPSNLSVSIFSAASSSPRLPFPHSIFSPPLQLLASLSFPCFPFIEPPPFHQVTPLISLYRCLFLLSPATTLFSSSDRSLFF